jgi:hypothetical protein
MAEISVNYKGVTILYHEGEALWKSPMINYQHAKLKAVKAKVDGLARTEIPLNSRIPVYRAPSMYRPGDKLQLMHVVARDKVGRVYVTFFDGNERPRRERMGVSELVPASDDVVAKMAQAAALKEQSEALMKEAGDIVLSIRKLSAEDLVSVEEEEIYNA